MQSFAAIINTIFPPSQFIAIDIRGWHKGFNITVNNVSCVLKNKMTIRAILGGEGFEYSDQY